MRKLRRQITDAKILALICNDLGVLASLNGSIELAISRFSEAICLDADCDAARANLAELQLLEPTVAEDRLSDSLSSDPSPTDYDNPNRVARSPAGKAESGFPDRDGEFGNPSAQCVPSSCGCPHGVWQRNSRDRRPDTRRASRSHRWSHRPVDIGTSGARKLATKLPYARFVPWKPQPLSRSTRLAYYSQLRIVPWTERPHRCWFLHSLRFRLSVSRPRPQSRFLHIDVQKICRLAIVARNSACCSHPPWVSTRTDIDLD